MSYDPEYHRLYRERNRERIKARKQQEYFSKQRTDKGAFAKMVSQ